MLTDKSPKRWPTFNHRQIDNSPCSILILPGVPCLLELLTVISLTVVVAIVPGPDFAVVLRNAWILGVFSAKD